MKKHYLIYSSWDNLLEESKAFFTMIHNNDPELGRKTYENYFLKYNLIHEVAHTIQNLYKIETDLFNTEQGANNLAVAYWREVEPEFINTLEDIVDNMITVLESPVDEGGDERLYFNENYEALAQNASHYGYYQFKLVYNALQTNASLNEVLVTDINTSLGSDLEVPYNKIKSRPGQVEKIVNDFRAYVDYKKVEIPPIITKDHGTPYLQFVTTERI